MVALYSTHCPKCKVLEMKLHQKNIDFEVIDDAEKVIAKGKEIGVLSAPLLEVDGQCFDFANAVKYINTL